MHDSTGKLKDIKKLFQSLFDNATDFIYIIDKNGTILEANSAAVKRLGYTKEEITGSHIADFSTTSTRETFLEEFPFLFKNKFSRQVVDFRCKNGEILNLDCALSVVRGDNEDVRYILVYQKDITRFNTMAEKLMLLEKAVDTTQLGVTITDKEGNIIFTNPADAKMHGYSVEELKGESVRIFAPSEFSKPMVLEQMRSRRRESINIRKDGSTFPVYLISDIVTNETGKPIGVVTICEDITERKKADERLMQSLETLKSVYEIATTPYNSFEAACDHVVTSLSKLLKVHSVVVQKKEEDKLRIISKTFEGSILRDESYPLEDVPCARIYENESLCYCNDSISCHFRATIAGSRNVKVCFGVPIKNSADKVTGFLCCMDSKEHKFQEEEIHLIEIFARYISYEIERNFMERQLRRSDKLKLLGQVAAGIAHQFRNPLNAILAITEAFYQDVGDNPAYKPFLEHIRTQIDRMSNLMRDLIDLGKPIQSMYFERESLSSICSSAVSVWEEEPFSHKHEIKLEVPSDCENIDIMADRFQMQKVLLNLLKNSAQVSPEGSEIKVIITNLKGNNVRLQVVDQGTGIAEEHLDKVFEPFFSTRKGCSGLGLSFVKHIVQLHGGKVLIYNNDPLPGCTVEINLPSVKEGIK